MKISLVASLDMILSNTLITKVLIRLSVCAFVVHRPGTGFLVEAHIQRTIQTLYCIKKVILYLPLYRLTGTYMCLVVTCWERADQLWCITVSLSLSHWYPGSSAVLDCIDS